MHNFNLPIVRIPDVDSLKGVKTDKIFSEYQFEIIKKHILEFQDSLDSEHDVGIMIEGFGSYGIMEVSEISYEWPVLMVFKGLVNGRPSTLIQHLNQLNFLLTTVQKPAEEPRRVIGFNARWAEE